MKRLPCGDDDLSGDGALGDERDHRTGGVGHARHPPRVVHEVDGRTEADARHDAVAGVLPGPEAAVGTRALGEMGVAQLGRVVEAAAGEQHAVATTDPQGGAVAGHLDADHPAVLDHQRGHRRAQPQRDARVLQRHPQPGDECPASRGHVTSADDVGGDAPRRHQRLPPPSPGALDHREVAVVGRGDPQAQRALHAVGPLELLVLPELAGVERPGLHRATERPAALPLGVVVGVALGPRQAPPPAAAEQLDRGGTVVDVRR